VTEPPDTPLAARLDLTVVVELGEAPEVVGEAVTVSQGVKRRIDVPAEVRRRLVVGARVPSRNPALASRSTASAAVVRAPSLV